MIAPTNQLEQVEQILLITEDKLSQYVGVIFSCLLFLLLIFMPNLTKLFYTFTCNVDK